MSEEMDELRKLLIEHKREAIDLATAMARVGVELSFKVEEI